MVCFHRSGVFLLGSLAVVVSVVRLVQSRDILGSSAAEDLARVKSGQVALGDYADRTERVAAQLIEIVVDADLIELEHLSLMPT